MKETRPISETSEERFQHYVERLGQAFGHADRVEPFRAYCTGLLLPLERKSIEPMAARLEPSNVPSKHQSLHHFVADGPWSDETVLAAVRDSTLPALEAHGPVLAWIVDDTGIPKKGQHSVGVTRQYCGQLGKTDNCQVAVSLSLANEAASLPIAYRLYLPESWVQDAKRRRKAGIPKEVEFRTKPEVALEQIRTALQQGVPKGVVLADAGYGNETDFRGALTDLELVYAVGVSSATTVWPEGSGPLPPAEYGGQGRPPKRVRRSADCRPVSIEALALSLPAERFRTVSWREGTAGPLRSRFAALRVRAAHRDYLLPEPRGEEWLLVEWPKDAPEPTKYWLSTLAPHTSLKKLVRTVKLRWRIDRDYQELKDELGLNHYEGRGWRGFHHHATLCIAAYAFLIGERGLFPPSGVGPRPQLPGARVPRDFRPRGAPDPTRTAPAQLNRFDARPLDRRSGQATAALPLLSQEGC
jgi:SRSO17 transposase